MQTIDILKDIGKRAVFLVKESRYFTYQRQKLNQLSKNINKVPMPKSKSQKEICFFYFIARCRAPPTSD